MRALPDKVKSLLRKPVLAHLATLMADGSPQVSPVWVDVDGDAVVINSAQGRVKDKNMRRDARVALSATDPANPYQAAMLRGRVIQIATQGADEHADRMAKKYLGLDKYPYRQPGEVRVMYRIEVDRVTFMG